MNVPWTRLEHEAKTVSGVPREFKLESESREDIEIVIYSHSSPVFQRLTTKPRVVETTHLAIVAGPWS